MINQQNKQITFLNRRIDINKVKKLTLLCHKNRKKIEKVEHTIVGQVWCFEETSSYRYQRMDFFVAFWYQRISRENKNIYTYKEKTHENLIIITIDQCFFFSSSSSFLQL